MHQYSPEEIRELIEVRGGNPEEQAAALAVVQSAIIESRRLGRVAIKQDGSRWQRRGSMRTSQAEPWSSPLR